MANITRDRAREIISEVHSQSGGFLGDNEQEKALGNFLGAPVLKAAAKAWTSDTRVFYELIQNSDDCSYTWADSQKNYPSLWFDFEPGRIIVRSNEDGFEESHVRALCSVGKTTKTGQIGEKGIGFKSVFKVAWKVQVQSGPFCFSLQHREGQNGLGMIAPVNEAHEDLSEGIRTQFTLFLINPEHCLGLRDKLLDLPLTITAFLRNTKVVGVWRQDTLLTFSRVRNNDDIYVYLRDGSGTLRSANFFLFTQQVAGLPPRESRPLHGSTEMTLAFPLSKTSPLAVPFAHAYLPLSAAEGGLSFVVHSDFVVQDNREDLAICAWNDHLLSELPQVFYAALKALSSMQQFQYTWPQFLPEKSIKHPQWARFQESVKRDLKQLPIFKTVKGTLHPLQDVHYFLEQHCDCKGNGLFSDPEADIYISARYSDYRELLKTFGLQPISPHQLIHPLRRHFARIPSGTATFERHLDDKWYTRVASLVMSWMDSPLDSFVKEVEALRLVPVHQKSLFDPTRTLELFQSPKETGIYFPHDACGNLIPDSILDTVPVANAANGIQKQLFTRLGVKCARQSFVIQCIYALNDRMSRPGVPQSVQNLRYLFLAAPDGSVIDTERILIYDDAGKALVKPSHNSTDVYFKSADAFGMSEIYRLVRLHNTTAHRLPSLRVSFLHPSYTTDFQYDTAWKVWLEETCSIRMAPRLETSDLPGQPSDILRHIVECVPEDLIGVLLMHRITYEKELANASPATISYIKSAVVPTKCGNMPLEKTFLERPDMTEIWSGSYLKDKFPFLSIPLMFSNDNRENWVFLSRFGVTTELTADYMLESLARLSQVSPREDAKSGFFKLYGILADSLLPKLWDRVSHLNLVYIPKPDGPDTLVMITDCIWDGPKWSTKYRLAQFDDYSCNTKVKELFQKVLGNHAPDWEASLLELSRIKHSTVRGSPAPLDIYNYLVANPPTHRGWDMIWDRFTLKKYIYIPDKDAWCGPGECVWSAFPTSERQYGIRQLYPDLEEFFVHRLGVYTPDVGDYVYEIELAALGHKPPIQISVLIQELSGLNPTAKELQLLEFARFLPVQCGYTDATATYVSIDEPFLIIDDERFKVDPRVPVLDMSTEDVCRSRTFITAMNLESRYLSRQIIERTCPVNDAEESADLTHALRSKAKFLYRCTIHYGSTKEKPEDLLSRATVFTAAGFRRVFSLESGLAAEVGHEGRVHIEESDGTLRIYVPKDPREAAISYATELPQALVRLLKICDKGACEAFATVLRESVDILDDILTERGIIQLPTTWPEGRALAIRTKNQVGSEKQHSRSASTSGCMGSTRCTRPIRLNASKEYLKELNSSPPYLTTLTLAYGLADTGVEDLDITLPVFGSLFSKENRDLTAIEAAMDWAAQNCEPGWMSLLLGRSETDDHIIITNSAVEMAVQNEVCGHDITECLFKHMRLSGQAYAMTETLLEAAAENEGCGRQIMPILLDHAKGQNGDATIITENVLKAAVENTESGDAFVSLLLGQPGINVDITEDVVIAAAENEYHGYKTIEQLFQYDSHITVSSTILAAAAGNGQQGLDITKLLLQHIGDNIAITEDVIISAMHNDINGLDILNLLKEHHCESLRVTENILIAATESDYYPDIQTLLDLSQDHPVTTAVIEADAKSRNGGEKELGYLLSLKGSGIQITEEAFLGCIGDPKKVELLVKHQGRLTEAFLVAAVAAVDCPLRRDMLDLLLAHDLRITEAVLVEAARNPSHGITVVPLLLECKKQIRISEDVILAAVTNPSSYADGILQILWDRQPDVQISDETIMAAALTDTSSVVRLIELINDSPSPSVRIVGEDLLAALSGNRTCGAKALHILFGKHTADEGPIPMTDDALINAAANTGCGFEVMSLLLDHGDTFDIEVLMSEEVLIAAAGNSLWGLEILVLLVDHGYPLWHSSKVMNAAEENIWAGQEILAFMLRYLHTDDYVIDCESSEDGGSTFSGDTEVPEDGNFLEDKNSSGSAEGSEEAYETADDG